MRPLGSILYIALLKQYAHDFASFLVVLQIILADSYIYIRQGASSDIMAIRRQAIIWTNAGVSLIGPLETNFSEIFVEMYTFSFKKMHWKCRLENGGHFVSTSMC